MPLEVIEAIPELRDRLARIRATSAVGLVPTMGALHQGHARLIDVARRECGAVVVSVFVNPLQFDRPEDLRRYPRDLDTDVAFCRDRGVDLVFAPSVATMYPVEPRCSIQIHRLADHLCGRFRPGHFAAVATVVMKLLQIVQPHRAYFGEKDAQQVAVVRRMVDDFNVPTTIAEVATVREDDGLALSSRNRLLNPAERRVAVSLYRALQAADREIAKGARDPHRIARTASGEIPVDPAVRLEYLEIVDPAEMQPVDTIDGPVRIAAAMWVGSTRLIDNVLSTPPRG